MKKGDVRKDSDDARLADFLYEVGSLRKLARMHRQPLLSDDLSDNIASHSYRVALIGWVLAKKEAVDPYRVVMMCLLHDLGEARSNDHNWVHKKYVQVFDEEIIADQLGTLPFDELTELAQAYEERESIESLIAKDADLLDEILLLKEYALRGNAEARLWLYGEGNEANADTKGDNGRVQLHKLQLDSARALGEAIYAQSPSDWWKGLWTSENRKD